MPGKFTVLPVEKLFDWALREYETHGSIFGIHKELFFTPSEEDVFRMWRYGRLLETPLGVAAGPHTQLAQNIISAWLVGARYIELKTVQTLDEIEVTKPCINMADEGYNCEWSQELRLNESFDQYLNAFILIHYLREKLGFREDKNREPGFIFNMSVGYDMKGVLNKNMQAFLDKMENCAAEKEEKLAKLAKIDPAVKELIIPDRISDNVTLSTMHGCPAEEIEDIARYLLEERGYHTTIKLNPTLLGKKKLREILNKKLGYDIHVPDEAFAHDLKYEAAVKIIENLSGISPKQPSSSHTAESTKVFRGVKGGGFSKKPPLPPEASSIKSSNLGIKLTNTLETLNTRDIFPDKEKMIYMSGRALHPISINLAARLQEDFQGQLDISFCAGVDCFNIAQVLNCGLMPVTVCSDLLKPGGYTRLAQYREYITNQRFRLRRPRTFLKKGSWTSKNFCLAAARQGQSTKINRDIQKTASRNLKQYAAEVLEDPRYQKSFLGDQSIKTDRELTPFDCIQAPCSTTCPTHQEVPSYMRHTAAGDFDKALEVILRTNPFPAITGMVCDHQCMSKCTRINYDNPLQIREIKNFIRTNHKKEPQIQPVPKKGLKAAVIGAGPAGLSCAYFLALGGFAVEVYEAEAFPGGMAARAIPAFRLRQEDITQDIRRIEHTGINIHYNTRVDQKLFNDLKKENDYIFIGVGAGRSSRLNIPGENLENVNDALSFLAAVRRGEKISPAEKTAVIGGGSSAVDAARTAYRLSGEKGEVSIIYRRTRAEMPACTEEIEAAQHEGIGLLELTAPISIEKTGAGAGADLKLTCSKMKLGEKDRSGRRRPLPIENSLFDLYFDRIICAVGQQVDLDFLDSAATAELLKSSDFVPTRKLKKSAGAALRKQARETKEQAGGELNKQAIFFGGDALHGPGNLITAVADGRKAAERILPPAAKNLFEKRFLDLQKLPISRCAADDPVQQRQAAKREYGIEPQELPPQKRKNFETYRADFSETEAVKEAGRCLSCDQLCDVCVSVCPNRANISYRIEPVEYRLQQAVRQGEKIVIQDGELFKVEQEHQVLHMVDFCNACGNCRTFCPTAGAPYLDKPRFCLSEESFAREEGVYFFCREDSKRLIKWKPGQTAHRYSGNRELSKSFAGDPGGFYNEQRSMVNGQWFNKSEDNTPYRVPAPRVPLVAEGKKTIETLYLDGDEFVYRAEGIFARLDSGTFAIKEIEFLFPGIEAAGFRKAAEMSLLLRFSPSYLLVNE